jgi:hypothetical protein
LPLVNLPFGALTAAFIIPFLNIKRRGKKIEATWKQQLQKFDLPGTAVFLPAIICLLLALQWGGSKYEWKSGRIIALLVISVLLVIGFLIIQWWKQDDATVPPRIFLNRNVWGSAWFGAMLGACFFVLVYYLRKFMPFSPVRGNLLTHDSYLVPGHQKCLSDEIWDHELTSHPRSRHHLHGLRYRRHCPRLLHPLHAYLLSLDGNRRRPPVDSGRL